MKNIATIIACFLLSISQAQVSKTVEYNAKNEITKVIYGNGLTQQWEFDPTSNRTLYMVYYTPIITGQETLVIQEDTQLELQLEFFTTNDPDFPVGYTLHIYEGSNYTINNNTVIPNPNFYGEIYCKTIIENQAAKSDTFLLKINVLPMNDFPYVFLPIEDSTAIINQQFEYNIYENFDDVDLPNDNLIFSATLTNNEPLPNWLDFDEQNGNFSGLPIDVGFLNIKVTCIDDSLATVDDEFTINIQTINIIELTENIKIFPNPTSGLVKIDILNAEEICISLFDINGKLLFEKSDINTSETVDISNYSNGIYTLIIKTKNGTFVNKIVKI